MERIEINTGMDGFLLLKGIHHSDQERIRGFAELSGMPAFAGIEALAQLGAIHVRSLCGFDRHAFLLKVESCTFEDAGIDFPEGQVELSGELVAKSQSAFSYDLKGEAGGRLLLSGRFLFATTEYGDRFKAGDLQEHYRGVYSCLLKGSSEG